MARTKQTARMSSGGVAPNWELPERAGADASAAGPSPGPSRTPSSGESELSRQRPGCCSAEADLTRGGTRLPIPSEFPCNHAFLAALVRHPGLCLKLSDKFHIEPFLEGFGNEGDKAYWRKYLTDRRMRAKEMQNRRERVAGAAAKSPAAAPVSSSALAATPTSALAARPTSALAPGKARGRGAAFGSDWMINKRSRPSD
jgi:hypothetical protein